MWKTIKNLFRRKERGHIVGIRITFKPDAAFIAECGIEDEYDEGVEQELLDKIDDILDVRFDDE